ncbi:MAG TPA: hypothetical protein VIF62_10935 [Labilithrix sp.]
MRRGVGIAFGLSVVAACTSFGSSSSDVPDAGVDAEAGTPPPTPPAASDAGTDVGTPGCNVLAYDDFSDVNKSRNLWHLKGVAAVDATSGVLQLVPNEPNQTGGIWLSLAAPIAKQLHIHAKTIIDPAAAPADGMTFAWTDWDAGVPPLGGTGSDLALCNADNAFDAIGVVLESYEGEIQTGEFQGAMCSHSGDAIPLYGPHDVDIRVHANALTIATMVDQTPQNLGASRAIPMVAIGVIAATGGASTRHALDEILVEECP